MSKMNRRDALAALTAAPLATSAVALPPLSQSASPHDPTDPHFCLCPACRTKRAYWSTHPLALAAAAACIRAADGCRVLLAALDGWEGLHVEDDAEALVWIWNHAGGAISCELRESAPLKQARVASEALSKQLAANRLPPAGRPIHPRNDPYHERAYLASAEALGAIGELLDRHGCGPNCWTCGEASGAIATARPFVDLLGNELLGTAKILAGGQHHSKPAKGGNQWSASSE